MKTNRIIKISLLSIVLLVVISFGVVAWIVTAGLREPVQVPTPDYWPTNSWRMSSPEEQGFDSEKLAKGLREIESKQIDIDSLLIIRNGYIVLDAHFYPYDGTFPHDLASVTKSVMTTLIAIATEQGKLNLDAPVVSFFPERTIANLDDRKAQITVRHLAGMVNGMESGCFEGDQPTIDAMMAHPDYVQAALDRPMVSEPGTEYCYDSPGMHLLSAILQETTGMTALDFARQNLFGPLGIQEAIWESDPQGYSHGWGDLHLLPEDAAKIGFLWLHRGMWNGQQIVPEAWVLDSVKAHSRSVGPDYGYGYGWWVSTGDYYASGRDGQKIRVMASINTVVVTTGAGFDYPEIESWLTPILLQLKVRDTRPANQDGLAALQAALAAVGQSPTASRAVSSSDTARAISGRTYRCEENAAGLESLRMDFNDPKFATFDLDLADTDSFWSIGLDGSYRVSPEGDGMRGYWKDSQIFLIETFDIGVVTRQMEVDGDRLQFSLPDAGLSIACHQVIAQTSNALAHGWTMSTPEEQGFDSTKAAEGLLAIKENGTLIHSLMVIHNDKVILDAYFYPYDGSIYHDLASVTKSVMTTLIGIAADQGKLSLDDTLISFFSDREIANLDERKEKITLRHLASMSSGLECAQDDEITLIKMRASKDWVQFALDLPVMKEPGTGFAYCGVNMHLLSAILKEATGMNALEFARKNLFGPLGIQDVYWPADPQGVTHGWGDLCLHPADMAKFGSLFLHEGQWEGKQIVSRSWVESALQTSMKGTGRIEDYGYGWWIGQPNDEPEFLAAGRGGQKIKVYPRLKMIIVVTGGGFEYSEIEPYMLAAMEGLSGGALPPNPVGAANLNAALIAIAQGPQPEPVPPLPAIAKSISGQTFVFQPNPTLSSFRLDFDDPTEAIFQLEVANEPGSRVVGVGLDGAYRPSQAGRPIIARGRWIDEKTFEIDYNEGPGLSVYEFRLRFDGEEVIFVGPGWSVKAYKK